MMFLDAKNIQEARAKAYNIVADFASYLSVLLDISFYEPQSVYRNFVKLAYDVHCQRNLSHERFRTSFIDNVPLPVGYYHISCSFLRLIIFSYFIESLYFFQVLL